MRTKISAIAAAMLLVCAAAPAAAQIAVSANDNKAVLDNGVTKVVAGVPANHQP